VEMGFIQPYLIKQFGSSSTRTPCPLQILQDLLIVIFWVIAPTVLWLYAKVSEEHTASFFKAALMFECIGTYVKCRPQCIRYLFEIFLQLVQTYIR
jgi:hypothetical protein